MSRKTIDGKLKAEAVRRQLLDRRYHLLSQVARGETELLELATNVEPELVEEGQEQALAWLVDRLDEHDREEIEGIECALVRIDRGEYGICRECGKDIPLDRLLVVPMTERCVRCEAAYEIAARSKVRRG